MRFIAWHISQQGLRNRQQYEMLDTGYDHVGLKYISNTAPEKIPVSKGVVVLGFWGGLGGGGATANRVSVNHF